MSTLIQSCDMLRCAASLGGHALRSMGIYKPTSVGVHWAKQGIDPLTPDVLAPAGFLLVNEFLEYYRI